MDAFDQSFDLLTTKLRPPRPQTELLIARPSLLAKLEKPVPIRLLNAPAGTGKSTLAALWAATVPQTGWLLLDAADSPPETFWAYVIAALQTCQPKMGEQAALLLLSGAPLTTVLRSLLTDMTHSPLPFALVLDDYHTLADGPLHEQVAFFIDHLPAGSRILITCDGEPPLPVHRWRDHGRLLELNQQHLRWNRADFAALKAALGLSKRTLTDFLSLAALDALPAALCDFILRLSILDAFDSALAEAVTAQNDAPALLDQIVRAGLFLIPIDEPGCVRWHPLFLERLRQRAAVALSVEERRDLHQRAALAYRTQNQIDTAFDHALHANDPKLAATLALEGPLDLWRTDQMVQLRARLERLPDGLPDHYPDVLLFHTWTLFAREHSQDLPQRLDAVTRLLAAQTTPLTDLYTPEELRAILLAQRTSVAARFEHDLDATQHYSMQALKLLKPRLAIWRGEVLVVLGLAHQQLSELDSAAEWLEQAIDVYETAESRFALLLALQALAAVHRTAARLEEAETCYQWALKLGLTAHGQRLPASVWAYIGLGEVAYERDQLAEARKWLMQSLTVMPYESPELIPAYLALARTLHAYGETRQGSAYLERASRVLAQTPRPELQSQVAVGKGLLALWRGEHGLVWLEQRQLDIAAFTPLHEPEFIFAATLLIQNGDPLGAEALLEPLIHTAQETRRAALVIEASLLLALALQAQGKLKIALGALTEALDLGESAGYVRTFVDGGVSVLTLLRKWATQRGGGAYVQRLIAAFNNSSWTA